MNTCNPPFSLMTFSWTLTVPSNLTGLILHLILIDTAEPEISASSLDELASQQLTRPTLSVWTDDYGEVDTTWYPWSHIAEPHRVMALEIANAEEGSVLSWNVEATDSSVVLFKDRARTSAGGNTTVTTVAGNRAGFKCTAAGTVDRLELNETSKEGVLIRSGGFDVHC